MAEDSERFVDLHLHTNHSDGSDSPGRVVERAGELGFAAIAITDHDTLSGVEAGRAAAEERGIEFLPASEISAEYRGTEFHIVALGLPVSGAALHDELETLRARRNQRAMDMVARLQELGVPITYEKVLEQAAGGSVGRMHVAREILALGHARTVQDSFDKFIKKGRPAFVSKQNLSCGDAVDLIHGCGGLAFVAHPGLGNLKRYLNALLSFPFDGIEAYHTHHTPGQLSEFRELATSRKLLITGGSDCHGTIKGLSPEMGKVRVPYEHFERIKERL